jgi:hypothetical protein
MVWQSCLVLFVGWLVGWLDVDCPRVKKQQQQQKFTQFNQHTKKKTIEEGGVCLSG